MTFSSFFDTDARQGVQATRFELIKLRYPALRAILGISMVLQTATLQGTGQVFLSFTICVMGFLHHPQVYQTLGGPPTL